MRQEFLAKLYFAQKLGADKSLALIEKQKAECAEWLSSLQINLSKTKDEQDFERLIFQYRISQTKAMIEWLNDGGIAIHHNLTPNSRVEPSWNSV